MKKIPKLKKKKLTNIDPESLTAALHWDKLSPDTSLRGDLTTSKENEDIQGLINKNLDKAVELLGEKKKP